MTHRTQEELAVIDAEWREVEVDEGYGLDVVVSAGDDAPATTGSRALVPAVPGTEAGRRAVIDQILALFAEWARLEVKEGNGSELTITSYLLDVRQFLEWLLLEQNVMPAQARRDDIVAYRKLLVDRYAVTTVGRKMASVRRFFEIARDRGYLPANPAARVKSPKDLTAQEDKVKWLPLAALHQLLAAPLVAGPNDPKGLRDRAIMMMMAIHGLRVCEVARANLADLDTSAGESGTLKVLGKGKKQRVVYLTTETREELRKWLAVRSMMPAQDDALFLSMHWSDKETSARRMSTRGIREMVDGYLEKVGAKQNGVSCHSLRHTFATQSLAAGAGLLAISQALGHSSVTTTQVYAKIIDKARDNPAKFLVGVL